MGTIDCDPASTEAANKNVGAAIFYTVEDSGLDKPWGERVFLNPPYSQPLVSEFAEALASRYESGEVKQAVVLVNNATETTWFQRLLALATAVCLVTGRIRFLDPSGEPSGAPLQGQAILYLGHERAGEFIHEFAQFGIPLMSTKIDWIHFDVKTASKMITDATRPFME
jgi:ParB family chromosome partitioning protein